MPSQGALYIAKIPAKISIQLVISFQLMSAFEKVAKAYDRYIVYSLRV